MHHLISLTKGVGRRTGANTLDAPNFALSSEVERNGPLTPPRQSRRSWPANLPPCHSFRVPWSIERLLAPRTVTKHPSRLRFHEAGEGVAARMVRTEMQDTHKTRSTPRSTIRVSRISPTRIASQNHRSPSLPGGKPDLSRRSKRSADLRFPRTRSHPGWDGRTAQGPRSAPTRGLKFERPPEKNAGVSDSRTGSTPDHAGRSSGAQISSRIGLALSSTSGYGRP